MIKDIAKIVYACCEAYNVSPDLVCSKSKMGNVSELRKKILYFLHDEKKLSYSFLAKIFNRNPRTVRRAIELTRHRLRYERLYRDEYTLFLAIIKGAAN